MAAQHVKKESRLGRLAVTVVIGATAAIGGVATAPSVSATSDTIVVGWNSVLLDSVRKSTLGPPMVARALAIVHTCMYDAWAAYDLSAAGTRLGTRLRRPGTEHTIANKAEAISYAAYLAAVDLFPGRKPQFDAFMTSLGYDPTIQPVDASPAATGLTVCRAVLEYRHADGSNQLGDLHPGPYSDWTGYKPVNAPMVVAERLDPATVVDPNKWQPLTYPNRIGKVITPPYLAPHWGHVQPFAMPDERPYEPMSSPATVNADLYVQQADDLIAISANLTDHQKAIAEYWADGPNSETPPGHWNLFAQFVSERDKHTLDQDVKMFLVLNNALMDASIAAWASKRNNDSVRPITAIRYLYRGQMIQSWAGPGRGPAVIDGGTWTPYQPTWFPTPPFAEFTSGHSTFSAAAAHALQAFTGGDKFGYSSTFRAGSSLVEPGIAPRSDEVMAWDTFSAAAVEAGMSRRYGGIHFEQADLDGRAVGRRVGSRVWQQATACFSGICS